MSGKAFNTILDFFFPPFCAGCGKFGAWFCDRCRENINLVEIQHCPMCEKPSIGGKTHAGCRNKDGLDGIISVAEFKPPLTKAIYDLKYNGCRVLADILGNVMGSYLISHHLDFSSFSLVPIPLERLRFRWRGFNQAELLARILSKKLDLPLETKALRRQKKTRSQADIKEYAQRIANMENAFTCEKETVGNKRIVLVDDVITTGATIQNAAKALKQQGVVEVWGLTLARR